jgi:hypothetical protein
MKWAISIYILFISSSIYACECSRILHFTEKYMTSDFVAEITILKNHSNKNGNKYYRADIEIDHLYKGDTISSINVFGSGNSRMPFSSCDIGFKENTKLIIYSTKSQNGEHGVNSCSGYSVLNSSVNRRIDKELKMLRDLEEKNINYISTIKYKATFFQKDAFDQFQGVKLDKDYAIFQINFETDMSIESVDIVSGFNHTIDLEIQQILFKSKWSRASGRANLKRSMLVNYYYYETKHPSQSFLSTFNL